MNKLPEILITAKRLRVFSFGGRRDVLQGERKPAWPNL
jgi:hypothetical protein